MFIRRALPAASCSRVRQGKREAANQARVSGFDAGTPRGRVGPGRGFLSNGLRVQLPTPPHSI